MAIAYHKSFQAHTSVRRKKHFTVEIFDIRTQVKISVPNDVMMFNLEQEIHYSIQETMGGEIWQNNHN
ncbi:hypothetical protein QUF44_10475 [Bacillus subtilis]|nr:hypothetical protein [Bacillus subtilis]MDM5302015.1 hypothetical protein [Bacillus subtilis]MDM5324068.1 hypothetical protein [Bacillus subtilis]